MATEQTNKQPPTLPTSPKAGSGQGFVPTQYPLHQSHYPKNQPTKNSHKQPFAMDKLPKHCISKLTGKPVLHFTHANGIPSQVYEPLFDVWSAYFTVIYIPRFAATAGYAVDNHWQNLTQQIIDSVALACRTHGVQQVVAVGHSLGALCTLKAVYQAPHQFAQAVLMDPPLIYGHKSLLWHLAKQADKVLVWIDDYQQTILDINWINTSSVKKIFNKLPKPYHFMDKLSPAGLSKHRRDVWENRDMARLALKSNQFFAAFNSVCFDKYIEHGLTDTFDGKVTLSIPKSNEVAVFRSNPSWFWLTPNQPPSQPVTILAGEDSPFVKNQFYQKLHQRLGIPYQLSQGGHMFPIIYPTATADKVIAIIAKQC